MGADSPALPERKTFMILLNGTPRRLAAAAVVCAAILTPGAALAAPGGATA